jgi:hypothetical protein
MKTKLLLSVLLLFTYFHLTAQVPQGFNYQGIALDGTTPISTTLPVRITIQSDAAGTTIFWYEEHSTVTPNSSGLFTLVVGTGTKLPASTVNLFSDIDWSVTPKYIKTEINYGGWRTMGAVPLWTVPYSMVADQANGVASGAKLSVISDNDLAADALFEVKRKDGQTVFAVYPDAVNIYVPNSAKGAKGGFAIGGFESAKGVSQDFFRVTPDSTRIYIPNPPLVPGKGAKGGFAIGGFDGAKGVTHDLLTVDPDSTRIYVREAAKGAKGGFAIGGFSEGKGFLGSFMSLTPDNYFLRV